MAIETSADHSTVETVHADSADVAADPGAKSALVSDNVFEHQQTVRQVIFGHPVLIWWSFFFSVSAIGWYVQETQQSFGDSCLMP